MGYRKKDKTMVTDEWMDAIAVAVESGNLPGSVVRTEVGPGRPKTFDDDELESITFRVRKSRLPLIDDAAARNGESRSEYLRELIDNALLAF